MLTPAQIEAFDTFGFILLPGLLIPAEITETIAASEKLWTAEIGRSPDREESLGISPFIELDPYLSRLATDDRVYEPAVQLLGSDMIWSGSEGNRGFVPGHTAHHWHADRAGAAELTYTRLKIMIYLDSMVREQGAFRVIPGSHRLPLHEDLQSFQTSHVEDNPSFFGMSGAEVPCHAVETRPGDVVLFNQSLFHAVYGKTGSRRYLALKFAARPKTDSQIASLTNWSPYALEPHPNFLASPDARVQSMISGMEKLAESTSTGPP